MCLVVVPCIASVIVCINNVHRWCVSVCGCAEDRY